MKIKDINISKSEKIYRLVKMIPPGRISTYKEIALGAYIESPRQVGFFLARNPYIGDVPCHRVVNSDGSVGGYSGPGGKNGKIDLLKSEGVKFNGEKVEDFKRRVISHRELKDE